MAPRATIPVLDLGLCRVRDIRLRDAAALAVHANDRGVWLNLRDRFPHPYTEDDARRFIEAARRETPRTTFAIEVDGAAAGCIGLELGTDVERVSAEIGYWLGRAYWGRGIMSRVLAAVTTHALDAFGLERVFALPFAHNVASCRVLEKSGYVCEGRLRRAAIKDGAVLDQLLYARVVEPAVLS
jgi:[ribosomal protein S5]-alanine N-acetyltransferase